MLRCCFTSLIKSQLEQPNKEENEGRDKDYRDTTTPLRDFCMKTNK